MSMSDNISGHGSKSKKVARGAILHFLFCRMQKTRLSKFELVSAQSLSQVWVELKKKLPKVL